MQKTIGGVIYAAEINKFDSKKNIFENSFAYKNGGAVYLT